VSMYTDLADLSLAEKYPRSLGTIPDI
jgi:hypothetical protein